MALLLSSSGMLKDDSSMEEGTHLVLDGTQVWKDNTKAHGHNQDKDTRYGLPHTAQEYSIQGGDVGPEASGVEVDVVKIPSAHFHHAQSHHSCNPMLQSKDILHAHRMSHSSCET